MDPPKIRMHEFPKPAKPEEEPTPQKQISEAPLPENSPKTPKKARFLAEKNHQTEKETKARMYFHPKAAPPALRSGTPVPSEPAPPQDLPREIETLPPPLQQAEAPPSPSPAKPTPPAGKTPALPPLDPSTRYEDFLASSYQHLEHAESQARIQKRQKLKAQAKKEQLNPQSAHSTAGGYTEYIDDPSITEGDVVDLNTQEYRFIGYFTHMRKAIELVWNYPSEAAMRGMQGQVGMRFTLHKDGKVTNIYVINSSGHRILDESVREAIALAAPFSPLPQDLGKDQLTVTGTFTYVLR